MQQRECGSCTLCCKLMKVTELKKPALKWCKHCDVGVGCRIYENRPNECQQFSCMYLLDENLDEHWNPLKSKMVLAYEPDQNRFAIHVDPGRKDSWRKEPYYSQIKSWANSFTENKDLVIVSQGSELIAVVPGREINLGKVEVNQSIITSVRIGPNGREFDVQVAEKGDPVV